MNNAKWSEKYSPQSLEDIALPARIKCKLQSIANGESGFALLLYGQPGSGKTTAANLIKKSNIWRLDTFQQKSSSSILKECGRVLSAVTLTGERRTVIIDEIDMLSNDLQKSLCQVIDKYAVNNDFVATTNHIERLCSPLRSRLHAVSFDFLNDRIYLMQIEEFLLSICRSEGRSDVDHSAIKAIIKTNFPDIRKMVIQLQYELT